MNEPVSLPTEPLFRIEGDNGKLLCMCRLDETNEMNSVLEFKTSKNTTSILLSKLINQVTHARENTNKNRNKHNRASND